MSARLRKLGKSGYYFAYFYDSARASKAEKGSFREKCVPLGVKTKNAAMVKFAGLVQRYELGKYDPWEPERAQSKLSLKEAADRFVEFKRQDDKRPKTLEAYRASVDGLVDSAPAGIMVSHLRKEDIRRYIQRTKADGTSPSPSTKIHRYRHLQVFVRWLREESYIETDPMKGVSKPRARAQVPSYLDALDIQRILNAIDADFTLKRSGGHARNGEIVWLKDIVKVAVATGMRLGELTSRRWSHVDLERGTIEICDSGSFKTKSHRSRRIKLVGSGLDVVRCRYEERADDRDGPVFTYANGTAVVPGYVSKRFKHYARLARLPENIHFHSLRHTTATWLIEEGVNPAVVQKILGHKDLQTTMIYVEIVDRITEEAMEGAAGKFTLSDA
ncbi:MAG: hypothetical protein BMS9Abin05_2274 [Rhodothermia bacterium]|nr:MAG: hypothetical protein BMS9Abin05_2274 [Rhodothermia bacterium]